MGQFELFEMKVRCTFFEQALGTASADPDVHSKYIASKSPTADTLADEVEAIGVEAAEENHMTIFPRDAEGNPMIWDYQIRGCFKSACQFLKKVKGTKSSGLKAYKKQIDGLIFIKERKIPIHTDSPTSSCQRPLRASTAQGERIALANSEAVEPGAWFEFTVQCFLKEDLDFVREWLSFCEFNGFGQWRNSGKGRFVWEELDADGNTIGGNYDESYFA